MLATVNAISQPRSLDLDARERSRSEGEALSSNNVCKRNKQSGGGGGDFEDDEEDERMDTGHSTLSVPTGTTTTANRGNLHAGLKRRRLQLLQKNKEKEEQKINKNNISIKIITSDNDNNNNKQTNNNKPTIEEPPPSPTLTELFQPGDVSYLLLLRENKFKINIRIISFSVDLLLVSYLLRYQEIIIKKIRLFFLDLFSNIIKT